MAVSIESPGVFPTRRREESLLAYERSGFHGRLVPHRHDDLELALILDGSGTRLIGDAVKDYGRGDLCLLGRRTPHCWQARGVTVRALVVRFPSTLLTVCDPIPELVKVRELSERAKAGLRIHGRTRDAVEKELLRLFGEPADSWRRPLRLLEALLHMANSNDLQRLAGPGYQHREPAPTDVRLQRALAYIHTSVKDGLSHGEAASKAGLTAAAFSRFFQRQTGRTFEEYANEARLSRACRALLDSDRSITEIAFDAGFGSLTNFHRQFRRAKGITPTDFRRTFSSGP